MSNSILTQVVHGSSFFEERTGAVSYPIYQCATFRHQGLGETTGYDYSRQQNPTREELEKSIAIIESGKYGFAFSTGIAAIASVFELFSAGDHIIATDDIYGGSYRLFTTICKNHGLEFSFIDSSNISEIEKNIRPNTKALFIESPTNPTMKITDIKKAAAIAKASNLITIVDNTFMTPYFQHPLLLGADIVVHSGTKYIGGHNDTLAGFVIVNSNELAEKIRFMQKSIGAVLSPFDSWLILRGLKTLCIRMERQEANAKYIAEKLAASDAVESVYYPGLSSHPGHTTAKEQCSGFGAMLSFTVKDKRAVENILKNVKIVMFAESLGGVESLITYPAVQTHADVPIEVREKLGITDTLLRLSVGIENCEEIVQDILNAVKG